MHCVLLTSMDSLDRKHITIQTVGGQSGFRCLINVNKIIVMRIRKGMSNIHPSCELDDEPQTTKPARLPEHGHGIVRVPRPCHR